MTFTRNPQSLFVTGGAGFIGSAFLRTLFADASFKGKVVTLDALTYAGNLRNLATLENEPRHLFVRGSITDANLVARLCDEHHVDAIVNFAAQTHVDRSIVGSKDFIDTNVVGTHVLLEAVRVRPRIHFHQVSTDEV